MIFHYLMGWLNEQIVPRSISGIAGCHTTGQFNTVRSGQRQWQHWGFT
jgi:hypothetical protein